MIYLKYDISTNGNTKFILCQVKMIAIFMHMHKIEVYVLSITKGIDNCVKPFICHTICEIITHSDIIRIHVIFIDTMISTLSILKFEDWLNLIDYINRSKILIERV